jgi:glycosyltransferase involved in cell wall biosynthesis
LEKTAIISTIYPSQGGVATYTRYLVDQLIKNEENLIVLADKLNCSEKEPDYVIRCWDKNWKYPFQIIKEVSKRKINIVHIQQELNIFGGKETALLLPLLIFLLRLKRIKVIITFHGVIPLNEVTNEFLEENGYTGNPILLSFGLKLLYSLIGLFSNKIIVHEPKFKDYLKYYLINLNKVIVIKHGVKEMKQLIPKSIARKKLGVKNKYTFLYFGYITGYKGLELIIKTLKDLEDDDFNFLIIGSRHPRLKNNPAYIKYYVSIKKYFEKDKRCKFFDYAKEEEVNYYFRAADCAIFPYTVQMSSSGPMALAIANETLCIASEVFKGVLIDELIFNKDKDDLKKLMLKAKANKLSKYTKIIKEMKFNLSWKNIAKQTREVWLGVK